MARSESSPDFASVSVRIMRSAYTTTLPCSALRTLAFRSLACLKVIQTGAAYPLLAAMKLLDRASDRSLFAQLVVDALALRVRFAIRDCEHPLPAVPCAVRATQICGDSFRGN